MEGKDNRALAMRLSGIALSLIALFVLIASFSYLFEWKVDQSLLGHGLSDEAANAGGSLGNRLGYLLVGRWFGLGAFALVVTFGVPGIRLLFGKMKFSVVKITLLSFSAAFILSFILAFISREVGLENMFGGGLGGSCGAYVVGLLQGLIGDICSCALLLALALAWLFLASKRFTRWFAKIGETKEAKPKKEKKPKAGKGKKKEETKTINWVETTPQRETSTPVEPAGEKTEEGASFGGGIEIETPAEPAGEKPEDVTSSEGGIEIVTGEDLSLENEELPRIDIRDELSNYEFPPLSILGDYENAIHRVPPDELNRNNLQIRATLQTYKIDVQNVKAIVGPTVTLYKVYPAPGVRIASIKRLQEDIAMSLSAERGVRVVTLADSVGIEVANDRPSMVPLKGLFNDAAFRDTKAELPVAIGVTITQKVKVFDLTDAPHLLVAGATKQGKSVGLNTLITSLLYSKHPSELKFVFIDPKRVEFSSYANLLHHYLAVLPTNTEDEEKANAIAKEPKAAEQVLKSLCIEMDERYELLSKAVVNNVKSYNEKYKDRHLLPTEGHRYLPYLVVVVDEYADLTMSAGATGDAKTMARSISMSIVRLAQKGRAAGIHLVIATQRPSVDVITGTIKANFPTRIAFRVLSMTDSRTILDSPGAEKLIGRGDMIYYDGANLERVQCAYISGEEIAEVTKFIGSQTGYKKSYNTPYYLPAPEPDKVDDDGGGFDPKNLDERFMEAARMVVLSQRGSTSDLQRKLGMGYAKAGRVMDQLEQAGIVGPQEGSRPRQVLVSTIEELETLLSAYMS